MIFSGPILFGLVVVVVFFSADRLMLLGTLSNDDDDDSAENVTKKMNLCFFKLSQVYMDLLNMPSAGDFSWSWILKILFKFKNRKENSSSYVHVLHKTSNQEVSSRSRAMDVKEMY